MPDRPLRPARRRACLLAAPALLAAAGVRPARTARAYPNQPVRVVVPFPPGGGSDTLARFVAPHPWRRDTPCTVSPGWWVSATSRTFSSGV